MPRGSAHSATLIAAALVLAGFATVGATWRSVAALLFVSGQIPYAVSGGVAAVAMIGAGLAILNVQVTRMITARRNAQMQELLAAAVDVLGTLRERGTPAAASVHAGEPRVRVRTDVLPHAGEATGSLKRVVRPGTHELPHADQ